MGTGRPERVRLVAAQCEVLQRAHQPRLAEAGVGDEQQHVPHAVDGLLPPLAEQRDFAVAADQRRQPGRVGGVHPGSRVALGRDAEHGHRRGRAARLYLAGRLGVEVVRGQPVRAVGDRNARPARGRHRGDRGRHVAHNGRRRGRGFGDDGGAGADRGGGGGALRARGQRRADGLARGVFVRRRIAEHREKAGAAGLERDAAVVGDRRGARGLEFGELLRRVVVLAGRRLAGELHQRDRPALGARAACGGVRGHRLHRRKRRRFEGGEQPDGAAQCLGEVGGGGEAVGRQLRQPLQARRLQRRGNVRAELPWRRRVVLAHLADDLAGVRPAERRPAAEEAVQRGGEAVHVGAAVGPVGAAGGLLGAHVRRRARHDAALRRRVLVRQGEAEIDEHRPAALGEDDVRRLEVAVDDAACVGVGEGVGHLGGHARGLGRARRRGLRPLGQAGTGEQFGHDEAVRAGDGHVVDGDDAGVAQLREGAGLAQQLVGVGGAGAGGLDRHAPAEPPVERLVHGPEPAPPDRPFQGETVAERGGKIGGEVGDGAGGLGGFGAAGVVEGCARAGAVPAGERVTGGEVVGHRGRVGRSRRDPGGW